jgi:hypothetical protein
LLIICAGKNSPTLQQQAFSNVEAATFCETANADCVRQVAADGGVVSARLTPCMCLCWFYDGCLLLQLLLLLLLLLADVASASGLQVFLPSGALLACLLAVVSGCMLSWCLTSTSSFVLEAHGTALRRQLRNSFVSC